MLTSLKQRGVKCHDTTKFTSTARFQTITAYYNYFALMNYKPHLGSELTLGHKALGWVGREPGLGVSWLIQLLYELKLTWYLSIVINCQSLCLVLHELHIVKVELKETLQ